jgi:hypothetical protein
MKYKISKFGALCRGISGDKYSAFVCPFSNKEQMGHCGDKCPHFTIDNDARSISTTIELCHGKTIIIDKDDFIDERER